MTDRGFRYELRLPPDVRLVLVDAGSGVELQLSQGSTTVGTVLNRVDARHVAATLQLMGEGA